MKKAWEGLSQGAKAAGDEIMAWLAPQNLRSAAWLGLAGAALHSLALGAMWSQGGVPNASLRLCALAGVLGLFLISLFAWLKGRIGPSQGICQGITLALMVWYVMADSLTAYLALGTPGGWYLPGVMLLLAALPLPLGARLPLWAVYGLIQGALLAGHPLVFYGLGLAAAGFVLGTARYAAAAWSYLAQAEARKIDSANRSLSQTLERSSALDEATGVANRRAMSAWLEAVWPLCVRNRIPVEVIMAASRDGKKTVELASALKPLVRRQSDYLGRFDESAFVILYSGPSREDGQMLLKRVRQAAAPVGDICLFAGFVTPHQRMVAAQALTWAREEMEQLRLTGGQAEFKDYSQG